MNAPHDWTASAAEFERVKAKLLDRDDVTPEELEAAARKLMQRARDIRHTETLNAMVAARAKARLPRCPECDETEGEHHLGWCSFNGDEAWAVVE